MVMLQCNEMDACFTCEAGGIGCHPVTKYRRLKVSEHGRVAGRENIMKEIEQEVSEEEGDPAREFLTLREVVVVQRTVNKTDRDQVRNNCWNLDIHPIVSFKYNI